MFLGGYVMNLRETIKKLEEEYTEKGLSLKTKIVTQELGIRLLKDSSEVWMADFKNQLKLNFLACILKEEQYFKNNGEENFATMDLVTLINKYYDNDEALVVIKQIILNSNFLSDTFDNNNPFCDESNAIFVFSEILDNTLLKQSLHLLDVVKFSEFVKKDKVVEMPMKNLEFHNSNDVIQVEGTEKTMEQSDSYESSNISVR